MRVIYTTDDPTKIGGPGPIVRVEQASGAVRVAVTPAQVSTAPSSFAPITTAGDIVLAAGDRLRITNLGTNPLFVKRGTGASNSSFNYVLAAATVADNGTGASIVIDDFVGTVSFAGTSPRYLAWE